MKYNLKPQNCIHLKNQLTDFYKNDVLEIVFHKMIKENLKKSYAEITYSKNRMNRKIEKSNRKAHFNNII